MKYVSIFSVTLKSAITPSFIGLIATTLPGVRPSISFASFPTATTSPLFLLIATIEGSFTTMPLPLANTSVFAVPRSMARSEERRLKTDLMEYPFFMNPLLPCVPRPQNLLCPVLHRTQEILWARDARQEGVHEKRIFHEVGLQSSFLRSRHRPGNGEHAGVCQRQGHCGERALDRRNQ